MIGMGFQIELERKVFIVIPIGSRRNKCNAIPVNHVSTKLPHLAQWGQNILSDVNFKNNVSRNLRLHFCTTNPPHLVQVVSERPQN